MRNTCDNSISQSYLCQRRSLGDSGRKIDSAKGDDETPQVHILSRGRSKSNEELETGRMADENMLIYTCIAVGV